MFADTVCPREQIHDIGARLNVDQFERFVAVDLSSVQNALAQVGDAIPNRQLSAGFCQSHAHAAGNLNKTKLLAKGKRPALAKPPLGQAV